MTKLLCTDCKRPADECICYEESRRSIENGKEKKEITEIIASYDAKNHECCRCSRYDSENKKMADRFAFGAFFCSEECADRVSDYTLDDGQQRVPHYMDDLNDIQFVVLSLPDHIRDLYNDNLREAVCACTPSSEMEDFDRLINATARERARTLAKTLKCTKQLKNKKKRG